ncbi:hypothetical protein CEXT_246591 [Caerostris extrusa]|uniref:Uncharacterized protein n=1 Tax=Caerostris extrusa TaxID=172846 RepID=A0AAV4URK6_CAEEX|nr:hypothetical protein CEXT_246591 [Caerostris extrusa]
MANNKSRFNKFCFCSSLSLRNSPIISSDFSGWHKSQCKILPDLQTAAFSSANSPFSKSGRSEADQRERNPDSEISTPRSNNAGFIF